MTLTAQVLEIAPITTKSGLKPCTPNLMPFHIDYSGKAPISTYLRVEPAKEEPGAAEPEQTDAPLGDKEAVKEESQVSDKPSLLQEIKQVATRFISSFRGRKIQGLEVKLPETYTGVVLRVAGTGADNTVAEAARAKAKARKNSARRTRSSGFVHDVDNNVEEYDESMDVDSGDAPYDDGLDHKDIRTLVPTSQFSSIIVWHPDHPVDEGRDEYYRSLHEWTRLAHEIHKTD